MIGVKMKNAEACKKAGGRYNSKTNQCNTTGVKKFEKGKRYRLITHTNAEYLKWKQYVDEDRPMPPGEYEYIGKGLFAVAEGDFVSSKHIYKPLSLNNAKLVSREI